jgi:hypothetical protein
MFTVQQVLLTAGVKFSKFAGCHAGNVYITSGHQLIGRYKDLEAFCKSTEDYAGWHVHHVVEDDDLNRLGVSGHAPTYADQLCVLFPERAHIGRINSVLRRENPTKYQATGEQGREFLAKNGTVYEAITKNGETIRRSHPEFNQLKDLRYSSSRR